MLCSLFLNPQNQVNRHDNSTIIFTSTNENLTQLVKVLFVKVSEILDLSKFVRLFHRQSFALYGTGTKSMNASCHNTAIHHCLKVLETLAYISLLAAN